MRPVSATASPSASIIKGRNVLRSIMRLPPAFKFASSENSVRRRSLASLATGRRDAGAPRRQVFHCRWCPEGAWEDRTRVSSCPVVPQLWSGTVPTTRRLSSYAPELFDCPGQAGRAGHGGVIVYVGHSHSGVDQDTYHTSDSGYRIREHYESIVCPVAPTDGQLYAFSAHGRFPQSSCL